MHFIQTVLVSVVLLGMATAVASDAGVPPTPEQVGSRLVAAAGRWLRPGDSRRGLALEPWLVRCRRPAWKPIVEDDDDLATASKFCLLHR